MGIICDNLRSAVRADSVSVVDACVSTEPWTERPTTTQMQLTHATNNDTTTCARCRCVYRYTQSVFVILLCL